MWRIVDSLVRYQGRTPQGAPDHANAKDGRGKIWANPHSEHPVHWWQRVNYNATNAVQAKWPISNDGQRSWSSSISLYILRETTTTIQIVILSWARRLTRSKLTSWLWCRLIWIVSHIEQHILSELQRGIKKISKKTPTPPQVPTESQTNFIKKSIGESKQPKSIIIPFHLIHVVITLHWINNQTKTISHKSCWPHLMFLELSTRLIFENELKRARKNI